MSLLGHGWFSYSFGSGCLRQCPDTDDLQTLSGTSSLMVLWRWGEGQVPHLKPCQQRCCKALACKISHPASTVFREDGKETVTPSYLSLPELQSRCPRTMVSSIFSKPKFFLLEFWVSLFFISIPDTL